MKTRKMRRVTARHKWDSMKVSFWFAPAVMSAGAILLAWAMYRIDLRIPNAMLENSRLILSGTPGDIRTLLVGIATTVLATAGVVFSLLTLPLSTVAAQYGSRLLRLFLGDRTTQVVLGMFVGTFVYCLSAATSIPPITVQPEEPQVTATVGLLLMLATFGSLILLVQHISIMLQAPNIAARAGAELLDVVHAEIPEVRGGSETRPYNRPNALVEADGYPVRVKQVGYIQYIDPQTVLTLARENDLVIRLLCKPGCFVRDSRRIALVWPAERVDEQLEGQIRHAFQIGNLRTPTQDVAYAVNQLVEMAVRAMSPAINDPFTAMTCLDYIGDGLAVFIQQGEKRSRYFDGEGRLRLLLEPVTFTELLSDAFDMLRHASCDNASVLLHMLEVIDGIGQEAKSPEARQVLRQQVGLIQTESQAGKLIEPDHQLIQLSGEALMMKLSGAEDFKNIEGSEHD
jgi:uncharacterized membrane protein